MNNPPATQRSAIRWGIVNFGLPLGAALIVWDFANGDLADVGRGEAAFAVETILRYVWMIVVGGSLFGLFHHYYRRSHGGDGAQH